MIYKNGNIEKQNFYESDAMMINKVTEGGYTPKANKSNVCILIERLSLEPAKQYYVELTFSWGGFKNNAADNFDTRLQGARKINGTYVWASTNYLTQRINYALTGEPWSLRSLILSSDSGSKTVATSFTMQDNCTGYELGFRTDYSNGTGWVKLSNIKIIPAEYYVNSSLSLSLSLHFILERIMSHQERLWRSKPKGGGLV